MFNGNKICEECKGEIEEWRQFGSVKYCKACALNRLKKQKDEHRIKARERYVPKILFNSGKSKKFNTYFKYVKDEVNP